MKKLVSSNEAAQILGLSLQGIHYRIKKGQLESIKQDGKIFVYIDSSTINSQNNNHKNNPTIQQALNQEDPLLKAKDEQIVTLRKTIKFMKKQYTSEIERLDRNQKQILDVFQSEVDLLKSAFQEMKNIYTISHQEKKQTKSSQVGLPLMDIKDFFLLMKKHHKTDTQIKRIILEKVKDGDKRFIYKKESKEVLIFKSDFLDLI